MLRQQSNTLYFHMLKRNASMKMDHVKEDSPYEDTVTTSEIVVFYFINTPKGRRKEPR